MRGRSRWVWWFAVISLSGELILVNEYRTEQACKIVQAGYAKLGLRYEVTACVEKHA
jgi:hypothetical protein